MSQTFWYYSSNVKKFDQKWLFDQKGKTSEKSVMSFFLLTKTEKTSEKRINKGKSPAEPFFINYIGKRIGKKQKQTLKAIAFFIFVMAVFAAAALAADIIIDNTQPVVVTIRPTTASPNYTNQTQANVQIVFNYTEANPANFTINISNSTTTICTHQNTSGLVGGTNVTVTTNCTLAAGILEGNFNLTINMTDVVANSSTNVQTDSIVFDQTLPALSGPIPANNSNINTTQMTLGINTSEIAACRFSNSPDTDYSSMPYTFANTQATVHNTTITFTDFGIYNFYIRCRDNAMNANTNDFWISINYLSNATTFGRSVTMNLAFAIGNKSKDVLQFSSNYSASENFRNGTVVGIVASGSRAFTGRINNSYSAAANSIAVLQSADKDKFLLVITNGSLSEISSKIGFLGNGRVLGSAFGVMQRTSATSFPLYIVAEYDDIDIGNSTAFSGAGELLLRSWGPVPDGRANVTLERP